MQKNTKKWNKPISIIVAVSENNVIGKDNQLIWHLPADLRYFKEKTLGKAVIMGRKTYESIGRPLPQRQNIVMTHNSHFQQEGIVTAHHLEEAIQLAEKLMPEAEEIMIIGGSTLFEQALPIADKIYLTRIHHVFDGDVFFPALDLHRWHLEQEVTYSKDEKNAYDYTFEVYALFSSSLKLDNGSKKCVRCNLD